MESEARLRVFLDTNVIFSGVSSTGGTTATLIDLAARRAFVVVLSRAVISELVNNLQRKAPRSLSAIERFFEASQLEAVRTPPAGAVRLWTARGLTTDARLAAAATLAQVDYLCTGDRKLREVVTASSDGPPVVTPRQLLDLLTL